MVDTPICQDYCAPEIFGTETMARDKDPYEEDLYDEHSPHLQPGDVRRVVWLLILGCFAAWGVVVTVRALWRRFW